MILRTTYMALLSLWAGIAAANPDVLTAVNGLREAQGRPALRWDAALEAAARAHAQDMASSGFFAHAGADGSDVGARVTRAGYRWCGVAENIAKGQPDLDAALAGWMGSRGHRRNLLNRNFADVAVVQGPERIWVMVLARGC